MVGISMLKQDDVFITAVFAYLGKTSVSYLAIKRRGIEQFFFVGGSLQCLSKTACSASHAFRI